MFDHTVSMPDQDTAYNPLRVGANGTGAEMTFTHVRRPWVTDAEFARDAESVTCDLTALQRLLEASSNITSQEQP